jgi:glutaminyl-peptide cyclotransferase
VDLVWRTAAEMGHGDVFVAEPGISVTDDHIPLQQAGFRAIDVIDFDYGPGNAWWHTPDDTLDKISGASLKIAADVGVAVIRKQGR